MKNIRQKLRNVTIAGLTSLVLGCATSPKIINTNKSLHNGYTASSTSAEMDLRVIAGIASGTIKVKKIDNGYSAEGNFSQAMYPDVFNTACEIADRNGDKNITNAEAQTLLIKAYGVATR